ncbi:MAG: cytochrome c nitrite reductase small subunit [Polyangiaceae bacterium]|nr:cytochrome c nitrite reductase small subunit [Polyangiaceae bacterium]
MGVPLRSSVSTALVRAALVVFLGVFVGVGLHTFRYAEGLSYLTTEPAACANCHIMQAQYDGWQRASHHTAAVCVDCHLPVALVPKYVAKLENGWRHGEKFTTQDFEEPIRLQATGARIVEANCRRCHADLVHASFGTHAGSGLLPPRATGGRDDDLSCVHCHYAVGHGTRALVGGPLRSHERDRER